MHIKRYRFSEVFNFRDMGGLYAGNGKAVKWNMLFRSDKKSRSKDDYRYALGRGS